ncbi:hypothetical protein OUZ56_021301 [Daphnia magna]|uniref:Uncharacterized protein n=1 Tax=Daphnia magna TaxID=35525 RepID=A0ABQ9ZGZ5_9CRUS|nr:hypothetical protein OUZ56_021301 [Daphnia magna]
MSYKKLNSFESTEKNQENGLKRPFRHEAISSFDRQRSRDDFWPSDWLGKQVKTVFDVKGDQAAISSFDRQRSRDDFWPSDWLGKQVKTVFDVKGDQAAAATTARKN